MSRDELRSNPFLVFKLSTIWKDWGLAPGVPTFVLTVGIPRATFAAVVEERN